MNRFKELALRFQNISKRQKIILGVVTAVIIGLILTFVVLGPSGITGAKDEKQYEEVDEVVLPMSSVKTLDPSLSNDEDTFYIANLVYDGLFGLDNTMTPYNNLASEYSFNKDNKSITITLIDTTWQDGKALTGDDVVYTIEAYKDAGSKCNYKNVIDGIDYARSNGNTVTIYFIDENDMALDMLTFPILPEHLATDDSSVDPDFKPVGTGKYKVKSFTQSDELVLVPNEEYHGDKATNTLRFDTEAEKGDTNQLLQAGGISMLISKDADREANITEKDMKITDFPANCVEYVGFSCGDGITSNKNIRQAICYAIDTEGVIEGAYLNSGMLNDNLYFPGYLGIDSNKDSYPYKRSDAESLLKKEGYKDVDEEGYLINEDGEVLEITLCVNKADSEKSAAAASIATDLEDVGIKVNLKTLASSTYYSTVKSGGCDMFIGSYTFDEKMDMREIYGYTTNNYSKYHNDELIDLMDDLRSGENAEQLEKTYKKIKKIMNEDVAYYCICYKTYGAVTNSTFVGEATPIWNNYYYGCDTWKSKYLVTDTEEK